ncbi:MAG: hypothetical protein NT062_21845, partial [Proteobacteria bacterium]|nr:hypothetical protein [Pseudomonadota bacterium]
MWVAGSIVGGGCRAPAPTPIRDDPPRPMPPAAIAVDTIGPRPQVPLTPGAPSATGALTIGLVAAPPAPPPPTITTITRGETDALLARLEPLPDVAASPAPIVRPPATPPVRAQGAPVTPIAFVAPTGTTIADRPATSQPSVGSPTQPLAVPEVFPRGPTNAESTIRVRFDEAMVPIARAGEVTGQPPVTLVPAVAGTWRWLDTRVLEFQTTAKRFPMASSFTITVPAGTRAVSGNPLVADVITTFTTKAPQVVDFGPRLVRPDEPVYLLFDQDVDAAAIGPFLDVKTGRSKTKRVHQEVTIVTPGDAKLAWAKNPSHRFPTDLDNGRYVVVAPRTSWPADVNGSVTVKVGAPSKEGPITTTTESAAFFSVVPSFTIRGLECDKLARPQPRPTCGASGVVSVVLSNPMERKTFRDVMFQIVGQVDGGKPAQQYGDMRVRLLTSAAVGKTFTIKVATTGLVDIYGQALVDPRDQTFTTTKPVADRVDPWIGAHSNAGMFILDPRFAVPQWIVDTQAVGGLHVELYRVEPSDYFAYTDYENDKRKLPPGKKLFDKTYAVGAGFGGTLRQDLRPALDASGTGHVIAVASATPASSKTESLRQHVWIQVTKLGLTARYDGSNVHAWVDSIATDASFLHPVAQVSTSLVVQGRTDVPAPVATDADGQATFALPERLPTKVVKVAGGDDEEVDEPQRPAIVVARRGTESVFTSIDAAQKATRRDFARWYVTDDRFTYRPGEPVFVKGWLRWTHDGIDPDIRTQPGAIAWTLRDARGTKLATGTAPVSDQGGFDLEAQIPDTAQLGRAQFTFSTPIPGSPSDVDSHSLGIAVEEFRTPAFAVTMNDDVTHTGATPLYAGESIAMAASANYFGGGGLGGAKVTWSAHLDPTTYHPPGWPAFHFEPGVRAPSPDDGFSFRERAHDSSGLTVDAPTQLSGAASSNVVIAVPAVPFAEPAMLSVDATVTDVDRQTIRGSSRAILVHPSAYYVGGRVKSGATLQGGDLELIVTDVDGQAIAGVPIEVVIEGVTYARGKPVDAQACKVTSAAAVVTCAFQRKDQNHHYRAFARVVDGRGRESTTLIDVPWWVSAEQDFAISADKPSYRVGDVAKLTVRSTTVPATAVVTYARQGVIAQRRVALASEKTIVELPIEAGWVENVHVLVERRGASTAQVDPKQTVPLPSYDEAAIDLPIELDSVRLAMTTRPLRKVLEPGAEAAFEVTVAKDGKPVANAEVALMVVDEAILSLSSRIHEDPLPQFYATVAAGVLSLETFGLITDAGEDLKGAPGWERYDLATHGFTGTGYGTGGGRGGMRGRSVAVPTVSLGGVVARKNFRATAVFSPRLHTDADGKVTLTVKMPDSLTRFRVVALATANNRWFGKAENTVLVQLPINARTMPPRFLTQGDTFALPVVVQNLDRKPRTVSVAVRAANLASTAPGQRVTLAVGQRAEVRFPMATTARGLAAIQTIVASDATTAVDANTTLVQVYEPATTESFATYGIVDGEPQFEQLAVPTEIYPEVGGVEAEVSSTQLSSLTDAYWYLYAYPYECAEQRSARMLATTAMFDVLEAFATPNRPKRAEIEATRARDLAKLAKDQNDDGGWNFSPKMKSDPFITQQVLAALV